MYANTRDVSGENGRKFGGFVEKFHLQPSVASDAGRNTSRDTRDHLDSSQPDGIDSFVNTSNLRWEEGVTFSSKSLEMEGENKIQRDTFDGEAKSMATENIVQTMILLKTAENQNPPKKCVVSEQMGLAKLDLERAENKKDLEKFVSLSDQRYTIACLFYFAHETILKPEDSTFPVPCREILKLSKCFMKEFVSKFEEEDSTDDDTMTIFKGILALRLNDAMKKNIYDRCQAIRALDMELVHRPYRRSFIFDEMGDLMLEILLPLLRELTSVTNEESPQSPLALLQVKFHELVDYIDCFQTYLKLKDSVTSPGLNREQEQDTMEEMKQPWIQQGPFGDEFVYFDEDQVDCDISELDDPVRILLEKGRNGICRRRINKPKGSPKYRKTLKNIQRYVKTRRVIDETIKELVDMDLELAEKFESFDYNKVVSNMMVLTMHGMEMETAALMLAEFNNEPDLIVDYVKSPQLIT